MKRDTEPHFFFCPATNYQTGGRASGFDPKGEAAPAPSVWFPHFRQSAGRIAAKSAGFPALLNRTLTNDVVSEVTG